MSSAFARRGRNGTVASCQNLKARRFWISALFLTFFLSLLVFPIAAEQDSDAFPSLPQEYLEMLEGLPDALRESLPDEVFTTDAKSAANAWRALTSPEAVLDLLMEALTHEWTRYLRLLLQLIGVLLLRAVWNCFAVSVRSTGVSGGMQLLCRLVLFGIITTQALTLLEIVVKFYADLRALTTAFLPLMGTMYAMGGNVSTAVVNHSTLVFTFGLVEWIGGKSVVPLFSLCLAFALLGAFETTVAGRMQVLTTKIKKWYTTALSLSMLLISGVLAAQNTLTARADSLGFRTVRFAVSSSIPLVGGGVAEMLRTAAAGLGWLRGVVGIGGVVLLLWLLLPQIIHLLLTRLVFSVAGDVAAWFGCREEGKLLGEIGSLYGYLLAVISVSVISRS